MQDNCVHPSTHTFVALLKACARLKCMERGREIHAEVTKEGCERDRFVGSALVDMYAKCGSPAEAHEVFDELPVRDVVLWNALIGGFTEHGLGQEGLNFMEQMILEGVSPSIVTLVCSLKACGSIGAIHRGREIYVEIAREGFERDLFVGNTLVGMYVKCGSLAEAREVFDELPFRDVVSWNALISGYIEHGFVDEVLNCLEQMQLEGVLPNAATFVCSLKACSSIGAIDKGQEIHIDIAKDGFERHSFVCSSLLDMYAKCGLFVEAREVFDVLPVQDVVSWTALIAGYVEHGLCEEALNCLEQMQLEGVSLDAVTFVCCLKACGGAETIEGGRGLHAEIAKEGYETDPFVGNTLVAMYAKCGSLAEAREVFDKLLVRDVVSWTALVAGYAEHGLGQEALNCLEQMQQEGMPLDAVTFVCSLKACGNVAAIDKGRELYAEIAKDGFERDVFVGNALVYMYAKCGSLAEAQDLFDKLLVQDVVSWTVLIAGYTEHGLGEQALSCFQQKQLEGVFPDVVSWTLAIWGYAEQGESEKAFKSHELMKEQGLLPNDLTFLGILKACGNTAALETGKKIHAQMYGAGGLEATEKMVANSLIDMYGKCGSMLDASRVFDAMPTRNVVTWSVLTAGYARQGKSEIVFHLFERMRDEGIQPDGIASLSVLTVCSHGGLVEKGRKYFEAMSNKYGITPTIEHYNTMVDLLGRAGHLDEALVMLEEMPFQPDLVIWRTMLGACCKWGNIELGRQAFRCAMQLEGNHAAAYITMSNMYADAHT